MQVRKIMLYGSERVPEKPRQKKREDLKFERNLILPPLPLRRLPFALTPLLPHLRGSSFVQARSGSGLLKIDFFGQIWSKIPPRRYIYAL